MKEEPRLKTLAQELKEVFGAAEIKVNFKFFKNGKPNKLEVGIVKPIIRELLRKC
jgi:hypothetical protein